MPPAGPLRSRHEGHGGGFLTVRAMTYNRVNRDTEGTATAVLHVDGMYRATEKSVVESVLGRRRGVVAVEANPVSQTANVTYITTLTSLAELKGWAEECRYHCAGQSVPAHICDPMEEPYPGEPAGPVEHEEHAMPAEHEAPAMPSAEEAPPSPHDVMGHGGHAGMSMEAMVRDMRNPFLVAAMLSVPVLLWSPIGREVLRFGAQAPLGLSDEWFQLLLSLPVIFYSSWIFFDGAYRALRARTLDMMVLVAVATVATINTNGTLRARASKVGSDTALAQIVKLVQEAQNSKAPGQKLADRAAFWLVFVALIGGVGTLITWLLVGRPASVAILFAITAVVIACPDALGLATPTAIMVGSGLGATRGILFNNAIALETAARIDTVVKDETGTLTKGEPEVAEVVSEGLPEQDLLRLAGAVERESENPLAEAVVRYAEAQGVAGIRAQEFENRRNWASPLGPGPTWPSKRPMWC